MIVRKEEARVNIEKKVNSKRQEEADNMDAEFAKMINQEEEQEME